VQIAASPDERPSGIWHLADMYTLFLTRARAQITEHSMICTQWKLRQCRDLAKERKKKKKKKKLVGKEISHEQEDSWW